MTAAGGVKLLAATATIGGFFLGGCVPTVGSSGGAVSPAAETPREYRIYVANESSDVVSRVVFDRDNGARIEREIRVGIMPADTDGPHGIAVSPDGDFLYVTVAHGTPDGWLWKFHAGPDTLVARTTLGRFPSTVGITPDGQLLLVANFNLHGDPVPSDLSVVYAGELTELSRIATCVTPHGSRVSASGARHYSACVRSDQVVEVSLSSYQVENRLSVHPGEEGLIAPGNANAPAGSDPIGTNCSPTWVTPGAGTSADRLIYVACNAASQVLEVDVNDWRVIRRFETGPGPYNMAISPDGLRLIATLRGGQGIAVFDLPSGEELIELPTSQTFTHGVVISPDGRYAFVTNEALGSVRGTLDVFDLDALERVGSVELQHQPGGIGFWRSDPMGAGPSVAGAN